MNTTPLHEVKRIRKFVVEHPEMTAGDCYRECKTTIGRSRFYDIYVNETFYDPTYTRPAIRTRSSVAPWGDKVFECSACGVPKLGSEYYQKFNGTKGYRIHRCKTCYKAGIHAPKHAKPIVLPPAPKKPKRTPSIDCPHLCSVCGMGYMTPKESDACCDRVVRMVMER